MILVQVHIESMTYYTTYNITTYDYLTCAYDDVAEQCGRAVWQSSVAEQRAMTGLRAAGGRKGTEEDREWTRSVLGSEQATGHCYKYYD